MMVEIISRADPGLMIDLWPAGDLGHHRRVWRRGDEGPRPAPLCPGRGDRGHGAHRAGCRLRPGRGADPRHLRRGDAGAGGSTASSASSPTAAPTSCWCWPARRRVPPTPAGSPCLRWRPMRRCASAASRTRWASTPRPPARCSSQYACPPDGQAPLWADPLRHGDDERGPDRRGGPGGGHRRGRLPRGVPVRPEARPVRAIHRCHPGGVPHAAFDARRDRGHSGAGLRGWTLGGSEEGVRAPARRGESWTRRGASGSSRRTAWRTC